MSLVNLIHLARRHRLLFYMLALLGILSGLTLAAVTPAEYTAKGAVAVTAAGVQGPEVTQYAQYVQNQMQSYRQLATTTSVLAPVAARLHLSESPSNLAGRLRVNVPPGTSIIEVSSRATEANDATSLATQVAAELSRSIVRLSPRSGNRPIIQVTSLQAPIDYVTQSQASKKLYAGVGLVLGISAAASVALLRESLHRDIEDGPVGPDGGEDA